MGCPIYHGVGCGGELDGGRLYFQGGRGRGGAPVVEALGAPVEEGSAAVVVLLSRFKGT